MSREESQGELSLCQILMSQGIDCTSALLLSTNHPPAEVLKQQRTPCRISREAHETMTWRA
jgi:hypothetical protein